MTVGILCFPISFAAVRHKQIQLRNKLSFSLEPMREQRPHEILPACQEYSPVPNALVRKQLIIRRPTQSIYATEFQSNDGDQK
jgi:hypothetical protein